MVASLYTSHYTKLRHACFQLMLHGIEWDRENAERLRARFEVRRDEIKTELLKITDGFKLWTEKSHRSEEMINALEIQRQSRDTLKFRRTALRADGTKGKALSLATINEREAVRIAQEAVRACKDSGGDKIVEVGIGLSDDAIARYIYGKLGITPIYKLRKGTKKRTVTVDDVALKTVRLRHPTTGPLVDLIREHRKCTKLVSTYLDPEKLDTDGRLRCMYKTYGTNSGRLASTSNPEGLGMNLQNMDGLLKPLLIPDAGE